MIEVDFKYSARVFFLDFGCAECFEFSEQFIGGVEGVPILGAYPVSVKHHKWV